MSDTDIYFHAYSAEYINKWVFNANMTGKNSGLQVLTIRKGEEVLYPHDGGYACHPFGSVQPEDSTEMLCVEFTINENTDRFEGMLKVHHSEYGIDILDAAFYELISKVSGRMPGDNTMIVDKGTDDDGDTTVVGEDTDRD